MCNIRKMVPYALACLSIGFCHGQIEAASDATKPDEHHSSETNKNETLDIKKLSEAFGHFIGRNLKSPGLQFDLESIIKGMREGAEGKPAPMSDQEYETMMIKVQEKAFKQLADENLQAANEYLAKNSKAAGVLEIEPNKLQYIVLEKGQGPAVTENDIPLIKFSGKLIDGTQFGSSDDVGGAITVPLNQTIPGFSKGIIGMKEGEKRRLFVHPDLGYGTAGQLPPNALLIFDIEVVKANSPDADKKPDDSQDLDDSDLDTEDDEEVSSHK